MALPVRHSSNELGWSPLRELEEMHQRLTQLLETGLADGRPGILTRWTPPVDVEETDDAFVVEAELPGVKPEDVSVELQHNELRIHGEVTERERVGIVRRRTRRTGQFDYRVALPGEVDADSVEATLEEGILRVRVSKSEHARPRRIAVQAA
jgi:HSP20 family protein